MLMRADIVGIVCDQKAVQSMYVLLGHRPMHEVQNARTGQQSTQCVRQVVRELVKPPNQCALDAAQLAEELPRVLVMGGAVSPPAAVRFSIREHVWQREPPVNQVRCRATQRLCMRCVANALCSAEQPAYAKVSW